VKTFSQLGKTLSVFSLGMFCGAAYLISCGQTNTAVSGGGAIDATAITAETLVTTGTITSGGAITAPSITLTTGAGDGKFLTSNSSGDASWGTPFRTSCPTGYTLIGTAGTPDAFCISTSYERPNGELGNTSLNWKAAQTNCAEKTPSASLCSMNEWRKACGSSGVMEKNGSIWLLEMTCLEGDCDRAFVSSGWNLGNPANCEPDTDQDGGPQPRSQEWNYRCCFR